jgi:hypothetical protein
MMLLACGGDQPEKDLMGQASLPVMAQLRVSHQAAEDHCDAGGDLPRR